MESFDVDGSQAAAAILCPLLLEEDQYCATILAAEPERSSGVDL